MANEGDAHMDLLGVADDPAAQRSKAFQCVVWAQDRVCSERVEVGEFLWHPEHGHHHFQNFALYQLRSLKNGRPDMTRRGLIATSDKVSFCLMDTGRDTDDPSTLDWAQGWPLYMTCIAGTGHQGISRGWRDTYTYGTQGQQVVVDDVTPGIYALVVTVDPDDLIFETSNEDNTVVTKVKLTADAVTDLCVFNRSLSRCA